jgi:hypothetical protein
MQLVGISSFQGRLDEMPHQQKSAYEGGRRLAVPFVQASNVQSKWLEEITAIQDLPPEWVYPYDDPIFATAWTKGIGLTVTPLGFADTAKYIVADKAVGLSADSRQSLKELSELSVGWDGGRAKPIKMDVLGDVVRLLRWLHQQPLYIDPFIVPTFDGRVQMEWHDEKRSLEIEAVEGGWAVGGTLTLSDRQRVYFDADCERRDFERLKNFYDWFAGRELIWPSP